MLGSIGFTWFLSTCSIHNTSKLGCKDIIHQAYLEASAWADKLEKEDGAGREFFKVLCLCRKPKETGCFPSIKPEVKQVIKNIWFNEDFARNQGTREMLYEKLTAMGRHEEQGHHGRCDVQGCQL